jgi:xanthine/CO dehydrogenase XdhC/CoxF family maturation factor
VPAVDLRASDEDRQRIVAALQRHTGAGRLTLDEFAERVQVACDARTVAELAAVVDDLPADTPAVDEAPRRDLFFVFAIALATLVLLGVALALRN